MKLSGSNMYVRMLGFGSRANLASASASASAPGCRPILRKKKCSRLRRELLQVQAEKLAYVRTYLQHYLDLTYVWET